MRVGDLTAAGVVAIHAADAARLLELVVQSAGIGTFVHDLISNELFGNEQFNVMFGIPAGTAPSQVFAQCTAQMTRVDIEAIRRHNASARSGDQLSAEYCFASPDGVARYIRIVATVDENREGQRRSIGISRDITAERTRLDNLARQQQDLERVVEQRTGQLLRAQQVGEMAIQAGQLGVWAWDIRSGETECSERCLALYGLPAGSPLTLDIARGLTHPEDRPRLADATARALNEGSYFDEEYRIVWPDGSVHWVNASGRLFYEAGQPVRVAGVLRCVQDGDARILAEAVSQMILVSESDARLVYCNSHWLAYTGRTLASNLGYGWLESIHPDDRDRVRRAAEVAVSSRAPFECEARVYTADGTARWCIGRARHVYHPIEGKSYWYGSTTDIHELKTQEERLDALVIERTSELERQSTAAAHSELLFRTIFEDAPLGIALVDRATGQFVQVNDKLQSILGLSERELQQTRWQEISHSERSAEEQSLAQQLARAEIDAFQIEKQYLRPNGESVWCRTSVRAFPLQRDGIAQNLVMIEDISMQKETEQAIESTLRRFELASAVAKLGIWYRELRDGLAYCDQRTCDIAGYSSEAGRNGMRYGTVLCSVHPEDVERVHQVAASLAVSNQIVHAEYRLVRPDGDVRHVQAASCLQLDEQGRPLRVVGALLDVTEAKELQRNLLDANRKIEEANAALKMHQAELERLVVARTSDLEQALQEAGSANRAKSAFLATTSHELRTPLNAVIGFSTLLLTQQLGPTLPEQQRPLEIIKHSGEQLLALVQDILDITSIEAGMLILTRNPVRLKNVLQEACDALAVRPQAQEVQLRPVQCDQELVIFADELRVEQAVRNLIANALKYTDEGSVEVRAYQDGAFARVEVRDTGIGIPDDQLHKLFQPFQPIDGQPGYKRNRTGLGLAITKRLIEAMGGEVGVKSELNRGSTFWFTVPRVQPAAAVHRYASGRT